VPLKATDVFVIDHTQEGEEDEAESGLGGNVE
jgi:hypothetical protein